jgi:hypothetical protein
MQRFHGEIGEKQVSYCEGREPRLIYRVVLHGVVNDIRGSLHGSYGSTDQRMHCGIWIQRMHCGIWIQRMHYGIWIVLYQT